MRRINPSVPRGGEELCPAKLHEWLANPGGGLGFSPGGLTEPPRGERPGTARIWLWVQVRGCLTAPFGSCSPNTEHAGEVQAECICSYKADFWKDSGLFLVCPGIRVSSALSHCTDSAKKKNPAAFSPQHHLPFSLFLFFFFCFVCTIFQVTFQVRAQFCLQSPHINAK